MFSKYKKGIRNLLFFLAGVLIFWLIYKDQDIEMIKSVLQNDVHYFWIWVSLFIGLLSHISRAVRWNYLIEPLGSRPRFTNTFLSVMVGYLMNLVFPRMGEISRCGALAQYEKISFTRLIGTVITERIIDVMILLLFTLLALLLQFGQILTFLNNNPGVGQNIISLLTSPWLIGGLIFLVLAVLFFRKKISTSPFLRKIMNTLAHFKEGINSFRLVKRKGALIFHSFFIWVMYYLMFYVSFFAFDFTKGLNPLAGLTGFIMGSFGMVAPVQGGLGTWHFMTREGLALYGVAPENGIIFAFVCHTTMTLMIIILGLVSLFALPLLNRKK